MAIVALPSSTVMEAGHANSAGSRGIARAPAIPVLRKLVEPMVDI